MKKGIAKRTLIVLVTLLLVTLSGLSLYSEGKKPEPPESESPLTEKGIPEEEKLVVLWSSGDRDVALNMAYMYTLNSARFKWWDDITFVVWGPSAKLLTEDEELQQGIQEMLDLGITVKACEVCSDRYGVSGQLREMGIIVKKMSELTDFLKKGRKVLTF